MRGKMFHMLLYILVECKHLRFQELLFSQIVFPVLRFPAAKTKLFLRSFFNRPLLLVIDFDLLILNRFPNVYLQRTRGGAEKITIFFSTLQTP